ncbi:ASH1-related protein 2 putative isoform 1 [Tripterygium wilfordii]|uniref:ASH1-related protein 2 putative isoform 1 n=1 Tax=Tripterygium wilfordii TaxID=458696 RepID=A0A7J7DJ12_TRIWF|nr:histone-lysine N-methyltransferase ASHR2 [Tripterygium wilfordii]KAF5746342.1 ASH1-related protein 2 putative isoform 1 [Tripterygium wilfordii]
MAAAVEGVIRVEEVAGRGRALVATQPLRAGEIVLRESPILVYSALPLIKPQQHQNSSYYCDYCFRTLSSASSVFSCPCCSALHFCSQRCLSVAQSSSHSPWVCQALCRLRDSLSLQPPERQVQAQFLVAAYNIALVSPAHFQILLSLQGRVFDCDAGDAQFLHSLICSVCPPTQLPGVSLELSAALLAKDKLNAFCLMEPLIQKNGQRSVRAYAIYPTASFFNHDCLPNACRFDYIDSASDANNTDMIIRMIHDVPQGREICLSYFPVNMNYSSRQKRLLEDYGFSCDCDRCKVEATWSDNEDDAGEDGEDEEVMEEDQDEEMDAEETSGAEHENGASDSDFPHAYFFLRYMCNEENCGGTLAPLPPSGSSTSNVLECNVCGNLKKDEVINQ